MKIAVLTLGTRGDVQPYAVLARALQQRGHDVTFSTTKNFASLVQSYGLPFVPVEADYQAFLDSDEGKKIMKANPFAIQRNLKTWVYPLIEQSLAEFYQLASASDRVVYHVKTMADCFADQFPEKMRRAMVVPAVEPTREFANPALSGFSIPAFLNRPSYQLSSLSRRMLGSPIKKFRAQAGLGPKYKVPALPTLYGISPVLLDPPRDLPVGSVFTGYWMPPSTAPLPESILHFIEQGEAPLLLTFGSMPFKSKFDLPAALLDLTKKLNVRIMVVKGWGLHNTEKLDGNPSILLIDSAPFERLFPRVKAVIHHGGAGTTAECLRSGKPSLVCPVLYPVGDQMFWARAAYRKGISVQPVPLSRMSRDLFFARIKELIENQSLYDQAQLLGRMVQQENGLAPAVRAIEAPSPLGKY